MRSPNWYHLSYSHSQIMTSKLKQEVFPTPLPLSSRKLLPVQMPFEALSMQGVSAHQRCDEFQSPCWPRRLWHKNMMPTRPSSWIWTIILNFQNPAVTLYFIYHSLCMHVYIAIGYMYYLSKKSFIDRGPGSYVETRGVSEKLWRLKRKTPTEATEKAV